MKIMKRIFRSAIAVAMALSVLCTAQMQTNVPQAVPGAKPFTVEHIKDSWRGAGAGECRECS